MSTAVPQKCTQNARAEVSERIRQHLELETLEDRKRDALDFHTIGVASIRQIIQMAFDAGFAAAGVPAEQPTEPDEILATLRITHQSGRSTRGNWVGGTIAGHEFEALVFPEHAESEAYELGDSRISKLWLKDTASNQAVASFDRGWDMQPATPQAERIVGLLAAGLAETVFGR